MIFDDAEWQAIRRTAMDRLGTHVGENETAWADVVCPELGTSIAEVAVGNVQARFADPRVQSRAEGMGRAMAQSALALEVAAEIARDLLEVGRMKV